MKPTLSIIIVNWNTKDLIKQCLESIRDKDRRLDLSLDKVDPSNEEAIPTEIIVVDNGSTDDSVTFLKNFKRKVPSLNLILNDDNLGFAQANNQGIRIAKGEYILLLNSDTIIPEAAISQTLFWLANHPEAAVAGCKLLNSDQKPQASCGKFPDLKTVFIMLFLEKFIGSKQVRTSGNKIKQVDWLMGAFILSRKWVFDKVGLLDDDIFMYMEEVEWFFRVNKSGLKTFFYPNAKIIHLGGASSKNGRTGPIVNIYKGLIHFYQKHQPKNQMKLLKIMLKTKALLSLFLGKITNNSYLINTYEQALKLV